MTFLSLFVNAQPGGLPVLRVPLEFGIFDSNFTNKLQTATIPEFTMKISTKNTMEISRFPVTDLCMSQFSIHFDSISLHVFQGPLRLFFLKINSRNVDPFSRVL